MNMKRFISIAVCSLAIVSNAGAQGLGEILGTILGVVKEVSSAIPEGNESSVGLPQQNLSKWGIESANFSGITPLGDGRYAVVSDKGNADGFYVWKIDQDPQTGRILSIVNEGFRENKVNPTSGRDCEGVVYSRRSGSLFISGEADQKVLEYDLEGQRTGRELNVPEQFSKAVSNQGFEALGCGRRSRFWATTEATLPSDGPAAGPKAPGSANLLRIQSFRSNLQPGRQFAYRTDSCRVSGFGTTYVFGVPEVCAIPGGRLLVLEREANVPNVYVGADVICKLYSVKPRRSNAISPDAVLAELPDEAFLKKTLVAQWNTVLSNLSIAWANYEGMCLGAKLSNGKHTLILVSDSQGGYGKGPFHLQDYIKVIVLDD